MSILSGSTARRVALRRDSGLTLGGTAAIAVASLLSGIVLARGLGPSDRGTLAALVVWVAVLVEFAGLGIPPTAAYYVARERSRWLSIVRHFAGGLAAVALLGFAVFTALTLTVGVSVPFTIGVVFAVWVSVSIVAVFIRSVTIGLSRFLEFNLQRLVAEAFPVLPLMVLAVLGGLSVGSAGSVYLLASVLAVGAGLRFLAGLAKSTSSTEKNESRWSAPDVPRMMRSNYAASLASQLSLGIGLLFLAQVGEPIDVGIFAVALGYLGAIGLVGVSLGFVAFPVSANALVNAADRKGVFALVAASAGGAAGLGFGLAVVGSWLLPAVYGTEYTPAVHLLPALAVAATAQSVSQVVDSSLRGVGSPFSVVGARSTGLVVFFVSVGVAGRSVSAVAWSLALSAVVALMVSLPLLAVKLWFPRVSSPEVAA